MTPRARAALAAALLCCAPARASEDAAARQALSHAQDQYRRAEFKDSLKTVEDVIAREKGSKAGAALRRTRWLKHEPKLGRLA